MMVKVTLNYNTIVVKKQCSNPSSTTMALHYRQLLVKKWIRELDHILKFQTWSTAADHNEKSNFLSDLNEHIKNWINITDILPPNTIQDRLTAHYNLLSPEGNNKDNPRAFSEIIDRVQVVLHNISATAMCKDNNGAF